ncbi:LOW QUALITY PROTEIN: palmitoyltransferase ZDHHC23 [Anthonomus grandis grandis]|uniref:LOW QUALITY PROTEIN: palmitoyltransferase ZDHHC23 n=1 Tax=Anthonomus grandis grandis TaxID=2921223 RepID=UPI0021664306|nr:LOW QUALITY PROTEIN: palmitoyltransferase ZDHHC23 [Anthonomus grandis grandis]
MYNDDKDLCCCEDYDLSNERNHILACCCNCVDLDEVVDNFIKGKRVPEHNRAGFMNTMRDRLRVPWIGGAKQVTFDSLLPIFVLPTMFTIASFSLWWTVFSFSTVAMFHLLIFNFFIRTLPQTKFFFVWTATSIVLLYFIFEFVVIPFLEILVEENIALSILIFGFIMCLYLTKLRANQLTGMCENETEYNLNGKDIAGFYNCSICDSRIPDKDHHCVWFDCCISKHNQCLFLLSLFFAIAALLYSSNLTLTSVCHPFEFFKTILLPDDCSDVYYQFELGLSFVSAIYSILIAVCLSFILFQQIMLISLGIPLKDWNKLSIMSKLCLGLNTNRPHNRGIIKNWSRIMCQNTPKYMSVMNRDV